MRNRFVAIALASGRGLLFGLAATTLVATALAAAPEAASPEQEIDASRLLAVDTDEMWQNHKLLAGLAADPAAEPRLSDAQRIARLQRTLDSDQKHLAELRAELANLEKEYLQADADFKQLDSQLDAEKHASTKTPAESGTADSAPRAAATELATKWDLAKQRFELAIRERKALQTSIATLETKMAGDRQALDRLLKPADPAADPLPAAADADSRNAAATKPSAAETPAASSSMESQVVTALVGSMVPTLSPVGVPALTAEQSLDALVPVLPSEAKNKQLSAATTEAKKKNVVAHQAQVAAQSATKRAENLDRSIVLERTLLETAHERVANVEATMTSLEAEFHKKLLAGANPADLSPLRQQLTDAKARLREAQAEVGEHTRQIDELQSQLAAVHAEQIAALEEAEQRRAEARGAENHLKDLLNPLAWPNVRTWLAEHGSNVVSIVVALTCFFWLFRRVEVRLVALLARRTVRGTAEDRENRSRTLIGVVHNATGVIVFSGGVIMLLSQAGIVEADKLMNWLAVISLAVAFGAQSLVKDFFSGFMILLEQQYMVNDVVKIDDISGQVERITLRMTVVRDWEGCVHFIPHGEINKVSNSTYGWSRAVFNIGVAYGEDVDHVMTVLADLARQMREEPEYSNLIIDDVEMLGVDELGESAVIIRFVIKTRPLKNWLVRRELLRRIKNKFDQLGIEIPFPTRTLIQRNPDEKTLSFPVDEEVKHKAA